MIWNRIVESIPYFGNRNAIIATPKLNISGTQRESNLLKIVYYTSLLTISLF